jgi:aminopeptidase N
VEFFEKTIGIDYPYAKYAQVTVQDYIYGGMENTSATVMNMRMLYDERTELTRKEQNLVAHELAHQWWGDMLTCREWSHMWLNEGFATYYAYLYKEHHDGDDAFRHQMRRPLDVISATTTSRGRWWSILRRADALNNAGLRQGQRAPHALPAGRRALPRDHSSLRRAHKFDVVETQDLMRAVRTSPARIWTGFRAVGFLAGHPSSR